MSDLPTAMHPVALGQVMPKSWLLLPLTLGLGVIDQAVPSHDSIKVW